MISKKILMALGISSIVALSSFQIFKTVSPCDSPMVGGHTGAPGETACNGCHPGTLNSGAATFTFDLGTSTYVPGQTYTGTVRISQAGRAKFGFSGLALKDSNNTSIGIFNLIETLRTRTYTDGPRKYVSHTPCGADSVNANSWIFKWTAPPANAGNITLYVGLLASDHSHTISGDNSYTKNIVLTPSSSLGLHEQNSSLKFVVYPNPVKEYLTIKIATLNFNDPIQVSVLDVNGKEIYRANHSTSSIQLNTALWDNGIYQIKLLQNQQSLSKKIIIN